MLGTSEENVASVEMFQEMFATDKGLVPGIETEPLIPITKIL